MKKKELDKLLDRNLIQAFKILDRIPVSSCVKQDNGDTERILSQLSK